MKFSLVALLAASMLIAVNAAPSPQTAGGASEYIVETIPEVEFSKGVDFNDNASLPASSTNVKVRSVSVQSGERLDGISITFTDTATGADQTLSHGGTGGQTKTMTLAEGEFINKILVSKINDFFGAEGISSIKLFTNRDQVLEGGKESGEEFTRIAPAGFQIVGFHGNEDGDNDRINEPNNEIGEVAPIFGRM